MDRTYILCLNVFGHNILSLRCGCFRLSILILIDSLDLLIFRSIRGLLWSGTDLE